jgi:lysozyme
MNELGIDVSKYEPAFDWSIAARRGVRWASIRASGGLVADTAYRIHRDAAAAANVSRMPYHWYVPRLGAIKQAELFLSSVGKWDTLLPPMLDLENYGTSVAYIGIGNAELKPWLTLVEAESGKKPVIYTTPGYINAYLYKDTWLSEYALFVAHWGVAAPLIPRPWSPTRWWGWQYTATGDAAYYGLVGVKSVSLAVRQI